MVYEKKRVLITVKAYPNPSREFGETVCCAGVDINSYNLIRLYPVTYRDLESNRKFKKYSIVEVDCCRSNDDKRPESFYVNCDTIRVIENLGTESGTWKNRKNIVLKAPIKSMCQTIKDAEEFDLSLGIVRPEGISFEFNKKKLSDPIKRQAFYAPQDFFKRNKEVIEEIPFQFYYKFKCLGIDNCPGHKLLIIDWEICQAYRDWRAKYQSEVVEKIRERWLQVSDVTKKEVLFYVGNQKRFRNTFMVLGVFYPALEK
jgi:hypothetical protein